MEFPNDENGTVLQSMQDAGMDMTREYNVEFWHIFKEATSAEEMERRVTALGIQVEIFDNSQLEEIDPPEDGEDDSESFDDEDGDGGEESEDDDDFEGEEGFDVLCIVPMIPTHDGITSMEQKLAQIAQSCGGDADGWGVLDSDA